MTRELVRLLVRWNCTNIYKVFTWQNTPQLPGQTAWLYLNETGRWGERERERKRERAIAEVRQLADMHLYTLQLIEQCSWVGSNLHIF